MITPTLKRTTTANQDFQSLIKMLDYELWVELKEDQATYDQHNHVPDIKTAVAVYINDEPAAIGCFKEYATDIIEVKRMYVQKQFRGQGLSRLVLQELENWAAEIGYTTAILETSIHFTTARKLYETNGYSILPNYPPYDGLPESVCMQK